MAEIADIQTERIIKASNKATDALVKNLSAYMDKLPTNGGKFNKGKDLSRLIANLGNEIDRIVAKSGYPETVVSVARSLDDIQGEAGILLKKYNKGIPWDADIKKLGIDKMKEEASNNLVERLTNTEYTSNIRDPLRQALYQNISGGASVTETRDFLKRMLLAGDADKYAPMARWSGQLTLDTLLGYDGQIYDRFTTTYEVNKYAYIGSLLTDSRPQCVRWINKFNGMIPADKLQSEITWAQTNGSGMKRYTTVATFCTDRGGYHCRHKSIPIFTDYE